MLCHSNSHSSKTTGGSVAPAGVVPPGKPAGKRRLPKCVWTFTPLRFRWPQLSLGGTRAKQPHEKQDSGFSLWNFQCCYHQSCLLILPAAFLLWLLVAQSVYLTTFWLSCQKKRLIYIRRRSHSVITHHVFTTWMSPLHNGDSWWVMSLMCFTCEQN